MYSSPISITILITHGIVYTQNLAYNDAPAALFRVQGIASKFFT